MAKTPPDRGKDPRRKSDHEKWTQEDLYSEHGPYAAKPQAAPQEEEDHWDEYNAWLAEQHPDTWGNPEWGNEDLEQEHPRSKKSTTFIPEDAEPPF